MTSNSGDALFQSGRFTLRSGEQSNLKIECDALAHEDWSSLANLIADRVDKFSGVEGVPSGGLKLAQALDDLKSADGPLLIVDDVLTTGASMEQQRAGRDAIGFVVFARGKCPPWVTALFTLDAAPQLASAVEALKGLLEALDPEPKLGKRDWLGEHDADECVFCDRGEAGNHDAACPMEVAAAALAALEGNGE